MEIDIKKPVGAEIRELHLDEVTEAEVEDLKMLLAKHGVLIFRNQYLSDRQFVAFMTQLGPLTFTVGETPVSDEPDLNIVSNVGRTTRPKSSFHIDSSYFAKPPAYTALRAVTIPNQGGETLFTNQYWSYETLPPDVKRKLSGRTFRHVVTGLDLSDHENAETAYDHPVFFLHPISQKKSIYMSTPQRCVSVSGMNASASKQFIRTCYEHSIQKQNIYRHRWQAGDVVIWDNGCTLHRADHSNVAGDRVLHRAMSLGYNL